MAKRKIKPRNVNPVARSLRSPALKVRVVKPKKGKGSYRRTRTNRGDD
jgi:stalled ribosome alternative rescue factor ArfA